MKISDHVSELLLAVLGWCLCVSPIMTQHRNLSCGLEADRLQTLQSLGRALGHFIFALIGLKRILPTNIFQRL